MISPHRLKKLAEELGIPLKEMYPEWRRLVMQHIFLMDENAGELVEMSQKEADAINSEVYAIWAVDLMMDAYHHREWIKRMDRIMNPPAAAKPNQINDDMIAQARDYPIEQLIDFNRGKIACPFHADKNPSAYHGTKTNRLVCPVCNKTWSALDILMQRDGINFKDAVLMLV